MKILVLLIFGIVLLLMLATLFVALDMRNNKNLIPLHKKFATATFWMMVVGVVVTEIMVRFHPHKEYSFLFEIHLPLAITSFVLMGALRFWITGERHPRLHKCLAYTAIATYFAAFLSGAYILINYY